MPVAAPFVFRRGNTFVIQFTSKAAWRFISIKAR
jgi:hypothetical protein